MRYGTARVARGVQLAFDPDVEYNIYRTIPHHIASVAGRLQVPGGFIGGRQSDVLRRSGLALTRRTLRTALVDGGHLFPFEVPWEAAQAIRRMAQELSVL